MKEEPLQSVVDFIEGNGEDYFITDVEETALPAYLDAYTVEELE